MPFLLLSSDDSLLSYPILSSSCAVLKSSHASAYRSTKSGHPLCRERKYIFYFNRVSFFSERDFSDVGEPNFSKYCHTVVHARVENVLLAVVSTESPGTLALLS